LSFLVSAWFGLAWRFLFCRFVPCLVLSCLALSCLVLPCLVLSCLVLSCGCLVVVLWLSCLVVLSSCRLVVLSSCRLVVLSCLVLPCLALSCPVLPCLVLFGLVLFCFVFSSSISPSARRPSQPFAPFSGQIEGSLGLSLGFGIWVWGLTFFGVWVCVALAYFGSRAHSNCVHIPEQNERSTEPSSILSSTGITFLSTHRPA
jgi:hypothetical protein